MRLEWQVSRYIEPASRVCGDLAVVRIYGSLAVIAAIDGLGHGEEAERAAHVAQRTIEDEVGRPLEDIVHACHRALAPTRGAVMSLAELNLASRTLSWLGVGNVRGLLHRSDRALDPNRHELLQRAGIVGSLLPRLHTVELPIVPGDLLIFGTDGLRYDFADNLEGRTQPAQLAPALLAKHVRGDDDALVLVARIS